MPGKRRYRGGRGAVGRRKRRVLRFLQPCLLILLRAGEAHGYALLSEIERFGFDPERLDPSLLYRALREMEASGWVTSRWDAEETQGPRRRVYALTELGEHHLKRWIQDLRGIREEIDRLLETYADQERSSENEKTQR